MTQLFAVILILLGAGFVVAGLVSKQRAKAASSWPNTQGVIIKSELIRHVSRSSGIQSTSYIPDLEYQYTVMGQVFTGKRLSFGTKNFTYEQSQEIAAKYPVGAKVPVYYNPNKSPDSILEMSPRGTGTLIIIGIVPIVLGVVLFLLS